MTDEAVLDKPEEKVELTDEQKRAKRRGLAQMAVNLATQARWDDALAVNTEILSMFPDDPEASNRVANAYVQLNRMQEAIDAYQHTLDSQPTNAIAQRNITRLQRIAEAGDVAAPTGQKLAPAFFVEEVGKTGMTTLVEVNAESALRAAAGGEVSLRENDGIIEVTLLEGTYVGKLESSLAERLTRLITTGNKYQAGIVMSEPGRMRILVRETEQSPENAGRISFPPKTAGVRGYTREGLLRRSGEDEDELESDASDGDSDDGDDDENPSEFGFSETSLSGDSDLR